MNLRMFLVSFIVWESLDFVLRQFVDYIMSLAPVQKALPDPNRRTVLLNQAPAYLKSTIHAVIVSFLGWKHMYVLFNAPRLSKLQIVRQNSFEHYNYDYVYDESIAVTNTNIILAGYLTSDLIHVLLDFPALGGTDTVLHHLTFLACAVIAGYYQAMPFIFAWLIVGETSTPFLNMRWLLIKCEATLGSAFAVVEKLFAGSFIFTRLFVYGAGLTHFFVMLVTDRKKLTFPKWALALIEFFVVAGFVLNLVWISKIAKLAKKSKRKAEEAKARREATPGEIPAAIATATNKDD